MPTSKANIKIVPVSQTVEYLSSGLDEFFDAPNVTWTFDSTSGKAQDQSFAVKKFDRHNGIVRVLSQGWGEKKFARVDDVAESSIVSSVSVKNSETVKGVLVRHISSGEDAHWGYFHSGSPVGSIFFNARKIANHNGLLKADMEPETKPSDPEKIDFFPVLPFTLNKAVITEAEELDVTQPSEGSARLFQIKIKHKFSSFGDTSVVSIYRQKKKNGQIAVRAKMNKPSGNPELWSKLGADHYLMEPFAALCAEVGFGLFGEVTYEVVPPKKKTSLPKKNGVTVEVKKGQQVLVQINQDGEVTMPEGTVFTVI